MIQKKITFDSFIRGILTAMVIIGILYLVNRLSGVLLPFFIAWLIAWVKFMRCRLPQKAQSEVSRSSQRSW